MLRRRHRRAQPAAVRRTGAALLGVLLALVLATAPARAVEVAGTTEARFVWAPASGPVLVYLVYVGRDGAPFPPLPDLAVTEPRATVQGEIGQEIVVGVSAVSEKGEVGPLSRLSQPVRFVATPSPPRIEVESDIVMAHGTAGRSVEPRELDVVNGGGGELSFSVSPLTPWLRVTPTQGRSRTAEVPLLLEFDTGALGAGLHFSGLEVSAAGAPSRTIPVALDLAPEPERLELSTGRIALSTTVGGTPGSALATLSGTASGIPFQILSDQNWIRPGLDQGTTGANLVVLPIGLETQSLPRGKHWGHVYAVPSDPEIDIEQIDVAVQVRDPAALPPVGRDVDCDGHGDLVWRHDASGALDVWWMDGVARRGSLALDGPAPAEAWRLAAVADVDADRCAELVFVETATGRVVAWHVGPAGLEQTEELRASTSRNLRLAGAGDFDGDGAADLFWHWAARGAVLVTSADGTVALDLGGREASAVLALGDVDASGTADVVWRSGNGETHLFRAMGGAGGLRSELVPPDGAGWEVAGLGDLDGDGGADLLWRNPALRDARLGRLEGPERVALTPLPPLRWPGWALSSAGDLDADGRDDLVWRHGASGQTRAWRMQGTTLLEAASLPGSPPAGWSLQPAPL